MLAFTHTHKENKQEKKKSNIIEQKVKQQQKKKPIWDESPLRHSYKIAMLFLRDVDRKISI